MQGQALDVLDLVEEEHGKVGAVVTNTGTQGVSARRCRIEIEDHSVDVFGGKYIKGFAAVDHRYYLVTL
jgi:hypothetical protein